jgi:predicted RNase H-like HicB family nuclease
MRLDVKMVRDGRGGFHAWCPALPGCAVRAESHTKARQDIADAIRGYVASLNGSHEFAIACEEACEGR